MARSGFVKTISLIVVAVVVIGVLTYAVLQPEIGWPSEDRRVVHPAGGFSVVQPIGWEKHVIYDIDRRTPDKLKFLPAKSVGNPGYFQVTRLLEPPTPADLAARGYEPTTFAGAPASQKWFQLELVHDHSRSLVFNRDGIWFDITIRRPASEPIDTGVWKAYAESLRVEPIKSPPVIFGAMTAPATAPTTTASP